MFTAFETIGKTGLCSDRCTRVTLPLVVSGKFVFRGRFFFLFSKYITFGNISYPSRLFIKISRLFIRDDVDCISSRSSSSDGRLVSFFFSRDLEIKG